MRRVGNVEAVQPVGDGLRLTGWTGVEVLHVSWPGGRAEVRPDRPRPDVRRRRSGWTRDPGFEVDLPAREGPIRIAAIMPNGATRAVQVPHPSARRGHRATRRLRRRFLRDMVRALPAFACYAWRPGPATKAGIKSALGLSLARHAPLLDASWLDRDEPAPCLSGQRFAIVMPVHNGFDVLAEALDRLGRHTNGDWRAIVVDDASTDPRVRPFLMDWVKAQAGRAELVALEVNSGFVAATNLGLARAEAWGGAVVLLNSDAHVPPDWAERLLAPLSDPDVASVTPFSNTAEIFSVPAAAASQPMTSAMSDRIDTVARSLSRTTALPSAPTGVGFCMALSRRWLAQVPRLDPAFGRGYGEEVDWCQRVRRLGGRHVCAPGLFVHHVGGESFGSEKARRLAAANARISKRYPEYDADVQAYLRNDPLRTPRLVLAIAWAGFGVRGPLPVYLGHSLGGGADMALEREIERDLQTCGAAVVLRVGGPSRVVVELRWPGGRLEGATSSFEMVKDLLAPVPRLRIVYSCGVGDRAADELPGLLLGLRRDVLIDRLEARLHDFFPVSPSYCLLGSDGHYRGPVRDGVQDPAHLYRGDGGRVIPLGAWQAAWRAYLSACDEITAYSQSAARIFGTVHPELSHRVSVRSPVPIDPPSRVTPAAGADALGVLGNLNLQKGAGIVKTLAMRMDAAGDRRQIVVIGNVDAGMSLPARVRIHGGYDRARIAELAQGYGIGTWIVPAIWPETFSFSTREALATGLPVFAFDLGAQGEAVRAAVNGQAVPHEPEADLAGRLYAALPGPAASPAAPVPARAPVLRDVAAS